MYSQSFQSLLLEHRTFFSFCIQVLLLSPRDPQNVTKHSVIQRRTSNNSNKPSFNNSRPSRNNNMNKRRLFNNNNSFKKMAISMSNKNYNCNNSNKNKSTKSAMKRSLTAKRNIRMVRSFSFTSKNISCFSSFHLVFWYKLKRVFIYFCFNNVVGRAQNWSLNRKMASFDNELLLIGEGVDNSCFTKLKQIYFSNAVTRMNDEIDLYPSR